MLVAQLVENWVVWMDYKLGNLWVDLLVEAMDLMMVVSLVATMAYQKVVQLAEYWVG